MTTLLPAVRQSIPAIRRAGKSAGPGAPRINEAYADFCQSITVKALVIGEMLREQRKVVCGGGQNNQHTADEARFSTWLEENCDIPSRTARRWMEMAERAIKAGWTGLLGHEAIDAEVIDIGGVEISFSQILSAPDKELPREALEARQLLFDFVGDKTMKECMALVIVEGKEPKVITLSHNGKTTGGYKGEDRKDFSIFVAKNLVPLQANLAACHKFKDDRKAQWAEAQAHLRAVIFGGELPVNRKAAPKKIEGWPREVCEVVADILKERLRQKDSK